MIEDALVPANGVNGVHKNKNGRGRRSSASEKRVTFIIPEALDQLLEMFCTGTKQLKNEVGSAAIADYLSRNRKRLEESIQHATSQAFGSTASPPPASRNRRA